MLRQLLTSDVSSVSLWYHTWPHTGTAHCDHLHPQPEVILSSLPPSFVIVPWDPEEAWKHLTRAFR